MKIKKKFVCLFLLLLSLCLASACGNVEAPPVDAGPAQEEQLPEVLSDPASGEEVLPALSGEDGEEEPIQKEEDPGEEAPKENAEEDREEDAAENTAKETASGEQPELPSTDTLAETLDPPAEVESPEEAADAAAGNSHPEPVEPDTVSISDVAHTCYMSISCATILENMELLDEEKLELIPSDGVLFARKEVTFYEGESVFNVLQRELKQAGMQMEHSITPVYNSAYIEGLANLYELDCGPLSGWMYQVNGWFPNYGSSRYQLQDGDEIQWLYSCDQGRDIGGEYSAGKQ